MLASNIDPGISGIPPPCNYPKCLNQKIFQSKADISQSVPAEMELYGK